MRKRIWKGLRAIEIAIILSTIVIILSVIVSRYPDFKCRSIESEAKFSLQEIDKAEQRFHAEHDYYASIDRLLTKDARVQLPQKYFIFLDQKEPTKDTFTIVARGKDDTQVSGEIWIVDQTHEIKKIKSVCRN